MPGKNRPSHTAEGARLRQRRLRQRDREAARAAGDTSYERCVICDELVKYRYMASHETLVHMVERMWFAYERRTDNHVYRFECLATVIRVFDNGELVDRMTSMAQTTAGRIRRCNDWLLANGFEQQLLPLEVDDAQGCAAHA